MNFNKTYCNALDQLLLNLLESGVRLATINLPDDMTKILVQLLLMFIVFGRLSRGQCRKLHHKKQIMIVQHDYEWMMKRKRGSNRHLHSLTRLAQ